jgi:hypothetical protein
MIALEPSPSGIVRSVKKKIDGWGSAVLGRVGMVRLSLASLTPFRTLKDKVMLKLTMVLSGIAVALTGL